MEAISIYASTLNIKCIKKYMLFENAFAEWEQREFSSLMHLKNRQPAVSKEDPQHNKVIWRESSGSESAPPNLLCDVSKFHWTHLNPLNFKQSMTHCCSGFAGLTIANLYTFSWTQWRMKCLDLLKKKKKKKKSLSGTKERTPVWNKTESWFFFLVWRRASPWETGKSVCFLAAFYMASSEVWCLTGGKGITTHGSSRREFVNVSLRQPAI